MKRMTLLLLCAFMLLPLATACGDGSGGAGGLGNVYVYGGDNSGSGNSDKDGSDANGNSDAGGGNGANDDGSYGANGGGSGVDDAVSMRALVGSWKCLRYIDNGYFWVFAADGSFLYLHINRSSTGAGSTRWRWDYASNYLIRGQYRAEGCVLRFTDCSVSANNALTENLWGGDNEAALKLLNLPMSDPVAIEDFYAEFEFNDPMSLRIAPDDSGNFDNDIEYDYGEDSHNVPVPEHIVPSREWPQSLLPGGFPQYGSDGRIRMIETQAHGDEVLVYVDMTTPAALSDYIDLLFQVGWKLETYIYNEDYLKEIREGRGSCAFVKDGSSVSIHELRDEGGRYLIHYVKDSLLG